MADPTRKHAVDFNDEEIFVIKAALEQFADIRDSEYRHVAHVASELYGRFPAVPIKWDDVSS